VTNPSPAGFRCSDCGGWHSELPLAFHSPAPAAWTPQLELAEGCQLTSDACVINGEHFFIRGLIRVPIVGHSEHFAWGVWASLSEDNFWQTMDSWETPGREESPPMFGWLSTELSGYVESTLNLRTLVHTQPVGERPHIELEPTEHPLVMEQRNGITWDALNKRVDSLLPEV
jgi:hypothetical protein